MRVKLTSICHPKQYKTISKRDLLDDGEYAVYGANGIIGKYHSYTHNKPMLLITCRGATSGNLNISKPFSYINGNAMTLDNLSSDVNLKYLYYHLSKRKFNDVITGSAQPQITRESLEKITISLHPLEEQKSITKKLDKAQELIELRKSSIKKLDELSKALFVDMFGDPVENEMGWEVVKLKEILITIDGGWSPVCENYPRENTNNAVLKLSALNNNTYHQLENKTMKENCEPKLQTMVKKRDLLFSRKNTFMLVGSCAYVFETEANLFLPDLIFRLNPTDKINSIYLWKYLTNDNVKIGIRNLSNGAAASMPNISKAKLLDFKVKLPPLPLQQKFAKTIEKIEAQKALYEEELKGFEDLFESLLSESFA